MSLLLRYFHSLIHFSFPMNMKRTLLILTAALLCCGLHAQNIVELPAPMKNAHMTLFQALEQRASVRSFKADEILDQTLAELLWAARGINRPDGRLTAPTAMNNQEICLYVCREDGCYLYDAKGNCLIQTSEKDVRKDIAGRQTSVAEAPVFLVLVADLNKYGDITEHAITYGSVDCGYVSQNICLACEALGLATVPRAGMDQEVLKKELGLTDGQVLLINHPVGYEK